MDKLKVRNKSMVDGLRVYSLDPKATDIDGIHAAITLLADAQKITDDIVQPDYPRGLSITGTKAGPALTGDVIIYGKDILGYPLKETIALNDDATVPGLLAFASVSLISLPARTTAADTVKIGFTDVIGLPDYLPGDTVLATIFKGVYEATRPTVTADKDEIFKNTVDPNSALDGGNLSIIYAATPPYTK